MKRAFPALPLLAEWILESIYTQDNFLERSGDLEEVYADIVEESGLYRAKVWLWFQIFKLCFEVFRKSIVWRFIMLKNYIKITFRNIKRHKAYSLINIGGLALGMTCFILIILYIQYELSYDKYFENARDVYRVIFEIPGQIDLNATTFGALAPAMKQDFPEVQSAVRVRRLKSAISYNSKFFYENNFFLVDPEFFDVFTVPLISGDSVEMLSDPFSVLVTEEIAEKYFGNEDPVGKTLRADNNYDYKITGVLKNPPQNSHFKFDFLASFASINRILGENAISWVNTRMIMTYIKLYENHNPDNLEKKLPEFLKKYQREDVVLHLQPLTSIHLSSHIDNEIEANSNIQYVYIFSFVAVLILLIACFNYMNLSTAQSAHRSKEIGVRKVIGAERKQIRRQFMGESIIFALAALFISIILVQLLLPAYNSLINRNLDFTVLGDSKVLLGLLILTILVGFISGLYPALFLSSFHPIHIVKGMPIRKVSSVFRNFLVVFQFVISTILIIGTLVVQKQLIYIKNKDMGFHRDQIVIVDIMDEKLKKDYEPLCEELNQNPNILATSVSHDLPNEIDSLNSFTWEGQTEDNRYQLFYTAFVDYEFLDFFGIELLKGRNFAKEFSTDKQACILNEVAAKTMEWENPIGKRFGFQGEGNVIGVINDIHHLSLHSAIGPTVFFHIDKSVYIDINYLFIKIDSSDIPGNLAYIEEKFKEYSPNFPFSYSFLDDKVAKMYTAEIKLGQIFKYFSFLAIFIACLGLFGLVTFTAGQRTKEIGVRKVLGATVSNIVFDLSNEFIKLVLIAYFIACPIAYFFINGWLQDFAYRTNFGIIVFILSALSVLIIVFISVSYQSINAAIANPAVSLRHE